MARFMGGGKTSAGSTTLPLISLYAAAGTGAKVREIGAFNTTAIAVDIKLCRISTTGTQGAGITETNFDPTAPASQCQMFQTHSSTGPTITDGGYRASLGASIGSGVIWTFGDTGLIVAAGTTNGIGIVIENGTGQALQAYIVWDE